MSDRTFGEIVEFFQRGIREYTAYFGSIRPFGRIKEFYDIALDLENKNQDFESAINFFEKELKDINYLKDKLTGVSIADPKNTINDILIIKMIEAGYIDKDEAQFSRWLDFLKRCQKEEKKNDV